MLLESCHLVIYRFQANFPFSYLLFWQVALIGIVYAITGTAALPQGLNTLLRPSLLESNPLNPLNPLATIGRQTSVLDELLSSTLGNPRLNGQSNLLSLLRSDPQFSVLVKALELTDLASSLEEGGPFTIFAPTNFAFDKFGREKMLSDVDSLRRLLLRHITRHKLPSLSIPSGVSQVDMASNDKVFVFFYLKKVSKFPHNYFQLTIVAINGRLAVYSCKGAAEVISTDFYASNGIVHSIDSLI